MNLRTKTIYPCAGMLNSVDLFGYVSHGIPGIDIVGLGKFGRHFKEKFIYLSRVKNLKMPKRRFVLCVEGDLDQKKFKDDEYRFLELPLLIMLWSLTGHLPFKNLEDCFASGKVGVDGAINYLELNSALQENLYDLLDLDPEIPLKIICPDSLELSDEYYHLSLEEILKLVHQSN